MTKKLYIQTTGCQMNEYDSKRMTQAMEASHGFVVTDRIEEADLLLVNTCSVREKAEQKLFSLLGQWRELKEARPELIIGVGGCVASQEGEAIVKRAPYIDLVFGPQTLHRLPDLYDKALSTHRAAIDVSFPEIEKFDKLPAPTADGPSAMVSIMEGCSKYCSFCVVPYTRGEEISRPFDDVLTEVVTLTEQGAREIILLGQNVNDYRGPMHGGGIADLALLIRTIASLETVKRIRFTTSHPLAFSDSLIQAYADVPKLANHLHLPVQSGSDRILALMKRGYTTLEYKSKIRKLRAVRPDIRISSDFIIGFPGETDADFEATLNLIHDVGFDNSFSYIYSQRPGTPAASLPDDVTPEEKKQRLHIVQQRIMQNARHIAESMLGTTQTILVSRPSTKDKNEMAGRTECNRVVNFAGPADLVGQMVDVEITQAFNNSLRGRLIQK